MIAEIRRPLRLWRLWIRLDNLSAAYPYTSPQILVSFTGAAAAALAYLAHPLLTLLPILAALAVLAGPVAAAWLRFRLGRDRSLGLALRVLFDPQAAARVRPALTAATPAPGVLEHLLERSFYFRSRHLRLYRHPRAAAALAAHLVRCDPRTLPLLLLHHSNNTLFLSAFLPRIRGVLADLPEILNSTALPASAEIHLYAPYEVRDQMPSSEERTWLLHLTRPEGLRSTLFGGTRRHGLSVGEGRWWATQLLTRTTVPGFVSASDAGALISDLFSGRLRHAWNASSPNARSEIRAFVKVFISEAPARLWCTGVDLAALDRSAGRPGSLLDQLLDDAARRCPSSSCAASGTVLQLLAFITPEAEIPLPELADSAHRTLCVSPGPLRLPARLSHAVHSGALTDPALPDPPAAPPVRGGEQPAHQGRCGS